MYSQLKFSPSALAVIFLMAFSLQEVLAAPVAHVTGTFGETFAINKDNARRALQRNAIINVGDTVETERGRLQLKFVDGGFVALQPNSSFVIEDYHFAGASDGDERSLFRLLRGGVRAITGLIGHGNHANYRLATSYATIGIRGTTYKALISDGSAELKAGLYATDNEGRIVVTNDAGEVELGVGQIAYVASKSSAPELVSGSLSIDDIPAGERAGKISDSLVARGFVAGEAVFQRAIGGVQTVRELQQAAVAVTGDVIFEGQRYAGYGVEDRVQKVDGEAVINGSFSSTNALIGVGATVSNGDIGALFVTNAVDTATDGVLYIGRWTAGTATAFNNRGFSQSVALDAKDSAAYIVGVERPTIPTSGRARYEFNGLATPSTGADGSIGKGVTGGHLDVDFGQDSVALDMSVEHGGAYAVRARGGFVGDRQGPGEIDFDDERAFGPNCSAGGCGADIRGFLSGKGAVPSHAGVAYTINSPPAIAGVAGFSRPK